MVRHVKDWSMTRAVYQRTDLEKTYTFVIHAFDESERLTEFCVQVLQHCTEQDLDGVGR